MKEIKKNELKNVAGGVGKEAETKNENFPPIPQFEYYYVHCRACGTRVRLVKGAQYCVAPRCPKCGEILPY